MRTTRALGQLLDACIDDARLLDHERRFVHGHRREVLEALAVERARFVTELQGLDSGTDVRPRNGSWMELGRELGRSVRGGLGLSNDGDSVAACRRSCRRTEESLDRALALAWPEPIRAALAEQRERLDDASAALVAIQF
jgi:hypothetical protein